MKIPSYNLSKPDQGVLSTIPLSYIYLLSILIYIRKFWEFIKLCPSLLRGAFYTISINHAENRNISRISLFLTCIKFACCITLRNTPNKVYIMTNCTKIIYNSFSIVDTDQTMSHRQNWWVAIRHYIPCWKCFITLCNKIYILNNCL